MRYLILSFDSVIARFANASDRDLCLEALIEAYPDGDWKAKDL